MALDKLVDSSQLDGALTETANAIRTKTGGSSTIAWDMDDGFSDAIDGIVAVGDISLLTAADLVVSGKTVTVPVEKYTGASDATAVSTSVADGSYTAVVTNHSVNTVPVVTGEVTGTVTNIGTSTQPSGTDGTDYWTITPSGSVTTTGNSRTKAKATISTSGWINAGDYTTGYSNKSITPTVTPGTPIYIEKCTVTTSVTADGMSTYFNSGTSSDKNVTLTPKYTNTAGYKAAVTTAENNGGVAYYKIKTASPTFSAAPTGGSTATSSDASISDSTNNSGVTIQTKYSVNEATISYAAAETGWIDKAASEATGSSTTAKSATDGTLYYINGVTMATPSSGTRTFTVTAPSGGTSHTYTFTQDANGRTTIKVDNTLTMEWNADTESLDFIYT